MIKYLVVLFMLLKKNILKSSISLSTLYLSFLILFASNVFYGQQTKFDSIFYHTAVNVTGTDPDKALFIADSLY